MSFINIENISRVYNPGQADEMVAVDSVSLSLESGDVVALTGPSGSGKTSLLSLLGCMARPTSGKIIVDGKNVVKLPERFLADFRRQRFGFIFQQFNLIRDLTAIENILLPLYPLNTPIGQMRDKAAKVMQSLNIESKATLKVKKLSGGEQQRVAIARAIINDPQIIIADEPTAHLDRKLSAELLEILSNFNREGRTIIIATHDPFVHENIDITSTVAMSDGKITEVEKR